MKQEQKYLEDLLKNNQLAWGKYYFPKHFRKPSPMFHQAILNRTLNSSHLAIAAPRESSKTTILGFLKPIHAICHQEKHFIVVITSVYSKSCNILDTIKYEIKENQPLRNCYRIKVTRDAEGDSIFRHPNGFLTRVLCKGRDQIGDIRGEKFGAYRPDLFILDDVEDDKQVSNPERRQEMQDLFDQVIMFAGEKKVTQYLFIGTILHDDSQLAKMVMTNLYPEFDKLLYKARYIDPDDGKTKSLWEEKWTLEDLTRLEAKNPVSFAKEMQNDPVSGARTQFRREDFRRWRVEEGNYVLFGAEGEVISKGRLDTCKAAIACDLAWEEKRENDSTVILPAFLTPTSDLLIDEYVWKKGLKPDSIEEILFTMENRLRLLTNHSVPIGFEKAKLEKVMQWLLKKAMRERNKYLIFKPLMWDLDKIQRIVTRLQPRYSQHVIYHKSGMGELEYQLLRIPSGTHDDLPDALQGVVQLLEYPRGKIKPKEKVDSFMRLRQFAIDARNPKRKRFVYGLKGKRFEIPATIYPI